MGSFSASLGNLTDVMRGQHPSVTFPQPLEEWFGCYARGTRY